MEYINFYVSIPALTYARLENAAKNEKITKNEIILDAILCRLSPDNLLFRYQKNAGISNLYNEI